jgi:hypothetical protein
MQQMGRKIYIINKTPHLTHPYPAGKQWTHTHTQIIFALPNGSAYENNFINAMRLW